MPLSKTVEWQHYKFALLDSKTTNKELQYLSLILQPKDFFHVLLFCSMTEITNVLSKYTAINAVKKTSIKVSRNLRPYSFKRLQNLRCLTLTTLNLHRPAKCWFNIKTWSKPTQRNYCKKLKYQLLLTVINFTNNH